MYQARYVISDERKRSFDESTAPLEEVSLSKEINLLAVNLQAGHNR